MFVCSRAIHRFSLVCALLSFWKSRCCAGRTAQRESNTRNDSTKYHIQITQIDWTVICLAANQFLDGLRASDHVFACKSNHRRNAFATVSKISLNSTIEIAMHFKASSHVVTKRLKSNHLQLSIITQTTNWKLLPITVQIIDNNNNIIGQSASPCSPLVNYVRVDGGWLALLTPNPSMNIEYFLDLSHA